MDVKQLNSGEWAVGKNRFPSRLQAIEYAVKVRQESINYSRIEPIWPPPIRIAVASKLVERGKRLGVNVNAVAKTTSHVLPTSNWLKSREG